MINLNVLIKEKVRKKLRRKIKIKYSHLLISNKSQEAGAHSWEDPKRKEIQIFTSLTLDSISNLFLNLITIFQQTKLTSHYLDERKASNQLQEQEKFSMHIQCIYNTVCFTMDKIIKKFVESNAAQGFCLMKNSEKKEINTSTKVNTVKHWITTKGHFLFSNGFNIMKKMPLKKLYLISLLSNLLNLQKIFL